MKYLSLLFLLALTACVHGAGLTVSTTGGVAYGLSINNTNSGHVYFGTNMDGDYMSLISPPIQVLKGNGSSAVNYAFFGSDEYQPRGVLIGSTVTGFGPVVFFDGWDATSGPKDFPIALQHASFAPVLIGTDSQFMGGPMLQVHGDVASDGAYYGDGSHLTGISGGSSGATNVDNVRVKLDANTNITIKSTYATVTATTGTTVINCSVTNKIKLVLQANTTLTITNLPAFETLLLMVHQDSTGNRVLTGDGGQQFATLPISGVTSIGNQYPLNTNAFALDVYTLVQTETNTLVLGVAPGFARGNTQ